MRAISKTIFAAGLGLIWGLLGWIVPVAAASGGPDFLVQPVYPDNQLEKTGYFSIRVEPGQEQVLTVLVSNSSSREIKVEVEAVNASTAPDGFIDYATAGVRDETMRYPFEEIAQVPRDPIAIPAQGQREIAVQVQVPKEPFDGMILGGIRVLKLGEEEAGGMITNAYQYAMAVAMTANDREVSPDFELVDVQPGLENYRAAVTASIRNPQAAPVKGANAQAELFLKGDNEAFYTMDKTIDMAPNSVWDCSLVDQAGYGYQAGEYLLRMQLELDGQIWSFEREFTITGTQADSINGSAVNQQQAVAGGVPGWAVVLCVLGLLVLLALVGLLVMLAKRKRE